MKNVKELKAQAKELNIKGYSAMNKETLIAAIETAIADQQRADAQQPVVCIRCNQLHDDRLSSFCNNCKDMLRVDGTSAAVREEDDFFNPSASSASINNDNDLVAAAIVEQSKRIAFIKADNTQLYFRADGQVVKVYWSTEDYRLHLQSERRGDRTTKYAQLVGMFAKLKNGIDGDVARVMKAIVRLKDMPAAIKAIRMKHLVEAGKVHRPQSMEKASSANRNRGCVDPQWMSRYVAWCEDTIGRKPTGLEIRAAWLEEQQA